MFKLKLSTGDLIDIDASDKQRLDRRNVFDPRARLILSNGMVICEGYIAAYGDEKLFKETPSAAKKVDTTTQSVNTQEKASMLLTQKKTASSHRRKKI